MLKKGQSIHSQISNWLKKRIEDSHYAPDEKLPSENELANRFEVSRVTVRRALQTLESEGLLYRSQGLGSFVSDNRSRQSLVRLTDFTEDMIRAGMAPSSEVVRFEQTVAPDYVCERLGLGPETKVTRLDRLRNGDGQPMAFDITWVPMFYGQLLDGHDLNERTIYKILEEEYDIPVVRGCYRIQAENADSWLSSHLQIREGAALLLIDRLSFTLKDKPIYYQKRYYRSDKVLYELLLEREPNHKGKSGDLPLRELLPIFPSP